MKWRKNGNRKKVLRRKCRTVVKRWKAGRVRNGIKKEEIPTVNVTTKIIKKGRGRDDSWPTDLCGMWNLLIFIIQS